MEYDNFFYFFNSGSESNEMMFNDISMMTNAKQFSWAFEIRNPILRFLNRLHMSPRINMHVDLPFKSVWNRKYIIEQDEFHESCCKWIIVTNWSVRRFSKSYLVKLSKKENIRLILLYLDPADAVPRFYKKQIESIEFDLIYSFQEEDCKKFGWIYITSLYSKAPIPQKDKPQYDVYYVGVDKGRRETVENVYRLMNEHGLKCNFNVISNASPDLMNKTGVHYLSHRLSYKEVLNDIANARCILEIVQEGQTGMTMRPYEALFYDKFLISNNKKIKEMSFYNPQYMYIFESPEEIDCSFLADGTCCSYNYDGDYSPVKWIQQIPLDYKKYYEK